MRLQVPHLGGGVGEGLLTVVTVVRLLAAVHQLVPFQVARCGEQLAAHFAAVPRLASVPLAVQVEQADLPVAFSTGRAAVWLQRAGRQRDAQFKDMSGVELRGAGKPNLCNSPVGFLVGFTGCRVRKGLVAVPTAERLLPGVNTHVSLEISSVGEFLPTVLQSRKCAERNEARRPLEAKSVYVTVTKIHTELPSLPRFPYPHHQHLCFMQIY